MGLSQDMKQLVQWFQKSSGWFFIFLSLFRGLASMSFPSFLQHMFTCNLPMTVTLVFDVRRSVIVGCDD